MKEAKEIIDLILSSDKIVITSHRSPDGDSIGSSLAMCRFIERLGKSAEICHPDPCPDFLNWVKGEDEIFDFESSQELVTEKLSQADLIFSLDYNGANRLGRDMAEVFSASSAKKIMIDHHLDPENIFDVAVSQPSVCSTAQLIAELILASGYESMLDESVGTPIYLGIVTDTGSFRFGSVEPRTHEIVGMLIANGVKHSEVHENTFDNNRLDRLKLRGYAVAEKLELIPEYSVAIISLTANELEQFNYVKGDTEGLVNIALSIEGVKVAVFLSEKDGKVKMSFRSKGTIPVNELAAENFSGGGHQNAAGGISEASMDDTIQRLKSLFPGFFEKVYA